jgi:arylsulfatase A-like enzyme
VKYPGGRWAGERRRERVSLVDVLPTLLQLAGVQGEDSRVAGRSLIGNGFDLQAPESSSERAVLAETQLKANDRHESVDLWARASGDRKCIWNGLGRDRTGEPAPTWQSFDLAHDPSEQSPDSEPSSASKACRQALAHWNALRSRPTTGGNAAADAQAREALRALGYIR